MLLYGIYKSLHCIVTMKIAMTPNKDRVSYTSAHVLLNLLNEKGKAIQFEVEHFIIFSQQV